MSFQLAHFSFKLSGLSSLNLKGVIKTSVSWAWGYTPGVPALSRLRQEGHGFKPSLGYIMRTYLTRKYHHCISACLHGHMSRDKGNFCKSHKNVECSQNDLSDTQTSTLNRERGLPFCKRKCQWSMNAGSQRTINKTHSIPQVKETLLSEPVTQ